MRLKHSLSFRQKILVLPGVAAVALALLLVLTTTLGLVNERRLRTIRDGYYPSVQASRDLREELAGLQRALQDAVGARDADRLEEADSLRASFGRRVSALRGNPVADPAQLDSLERGFDAYDFLVGEAR